MQLGIIVYEFNNNLGPINKIINLTPANEVYEHNTRYALLGNLHLRTVRTTRYGLKSVQTEGAKLWTLLPNNIRLKPSKKSFKAELKKFLISHYITPP